MDNVSPGLVLDPPTVRARNHAVIERLQGELRAAIKLACPAANGDYALLDFPNYSNIGDSAIYLGEVLLLKEHFGRGPVLVGETDNRLFRALDRLPTSVPLLLQGGGNFGDLYHRHQHFREAVISRYRKHRIVILPQSIHFEDEDNAAPIAAAIAAHPDVTLMVRDRPSQVFARARFTCRVMLVPDMAFMIGPIEPSASPDVDLFGLLRQDKERILPDDPEFGDLSCSQAFGDWPAEQRNRGLAGRLPRALRARLPGAWQGWHPASPAGFEALARRRVDTGLRLLLRGRMVLTDRLHAHILSLLLGKPHIVLDNSYGKIAKFADMWTRDAAFASATTLSEARAMLRAARMPGDPLDWPWRPAPNPVAAKVERVKP